MEPAGAVKEDPLPPSINSDNTGSYYAVDGKGVSKISVSGIPIITENKEVGESLSETEIENIEVVPPEAVHIYSIGDDLSGIGRENSDLFNALYNEQAGKKGVVIESASYIDLDDEYKELLENDHIVQKKISGEGADSAEEDVDKVEKSYLPVTVTVTGKNIKAYINGSRAAVTRIYSDGSDYVVKLTETGVLVITSDAPVTGAAELTSSIEYSICDRSDDLLASVPVEEVTVISPEEIGMLSADERAGFTELYNSLQNDGNVTVEAFISISVTDAYLEYLNASADNYFKLSFTSPGENVRVIVNGVEQEIVSEGDGRYTAKLRQLGAVAIVSDLVYDEFYSVLE